MSVAITLLMALLAILPRQTQDPQADVAMAQRLQQREEFLCQERTRLWREIEWIRSLEAAPLRSVLQHCLFWATAAAMLTEVCCLAWQGKLASSTFHEQDSSSSEEEEEDNNEGEQDLKRAHSAPRSLAEPTQMPVQELSEPCRNLKQLVRDLLYISREFSQRTFMPEMYPDNGMGISHESWSVFESGILYQMLVFLRPPPGHSFILEQVTLGQQPKRCSDIRVVLECMCSMEDLMGYSLCFLHRRGNQLPQDHSSLLLETLCTGFYLNVEKISLWVQNLLLSAWLRLPQWPRRRLTLLPCSRSCRFLVSSPSEEQSCTELVWAVQEGSTRSFLILE